MRRRPYINGVIYIFIFKITSTFVLSVHTLMVDSFYIKYGKVKSVSVNMKYLVRLSLFVSQIFIRPGRRHNEIHLN